MRSVFDGVDLNFVSSLMHGNNNQNKKTKKAEADRESWISYSRAEKNEDGHANTVEVSGSERKA